MKGKKNLRRQKNLEKMLLILPYVKLAPLSQNSVQFFVRQGGCGVFFLFV